MFFLWIPDVRLALARVADRVSKGGHDISKADVRRRFSRGLFNFFHLYHDIFDTWSLFDNSTGMPEQVARAERGHSHIFSDSKYEQILKQAKVKKNGN